MVAEMHQLPTDALFWQTTNEHMLLRADLLWVLQLPGWRDSTGVSHEIRFAEEHDISTSFLVPKNWG
jgi:hypothetical protein